MQKVPGPLEVHDALYAAMDALDFERMFSLMDENVVYQNMSQNPVKGREALRKWWGQFTVTCASAEIVNVAVNGNTVFDERRDHMILDGKEIRSKGAGVFVVRNGLITEWREYFDMRTVERQLGRGHPGGDPGSATK